jgi:hypothetical protein
VFKNLVGVLKKADQKRWAALLDEVISEDYSHEFIKGFIYAMEMPYPKFVKNMVVNMMI